MEIIHKPVLLYEAVENLCVKKGDIIVDCTIGEGGHSVEFLKRIGSEGFLIGIDLDSNALERAKERLSNAGSNFTLVNGNFRDISNIISQIGFEKVDKIFADLGVSSFQLSRADFGFSFQESGPLDMRMDKADPVSAFDVINNYAEKEIASILWAYGEERFSKLIAKRIAEIRKLKKINTTSELADIIASIYPLHHLRIHPATRTFQALRIYVNDELNNLKLMLEKVPEILKVHGRVAIISYHSLEDRIVKKAFKNDQRLIAINKKVLKPRIEEVETNRRARSAKMRVAERV
jgi:16S rRNA (cytosine1402-N4)-methyltransferase